MMNARAGDALRDIHGNFLIIIAIRIISSDSVEMKVELYDKIFNLIYKDGLFYDSSMNLYAPLNHSYVSYDCAIRIIQLSKLS